MIIKKISGYTGSAHQWKEVMTDLLDRHSASLEDYFYFNSDLIVDLKQFWHVHLKNTYFQLPYSNVTNLPPSYIHLWESGLIIFFDRFFGLFNSQNDISLDTVTEDLMYVFYHPLNFSKLKEYTGRKNNESKYDREMMIEYFSEDDIDYSQFSEEVYFDYPSLDSFLSLPAPSADILLNAYVIGDGDFDYNGSICWLYDDIVFSDKECEVAFFNYDDGVLRYPSFAEWFVRYCFPYFINTEEVDDCLSIYLDKFKYGKTLFERY